MQACILYLVSSFAKIVFLTLLTDIVDTVAVPPPVLETELRLSFSVVSVVATFTRFHMLPTSTDPLPALLPPPSPPPSEHALSAFMSESALHTGSDR